MKRRTFIKNTLPLAFSPLFVESMLARSVSELFGLGFSPIDFKDRKLVILNLFGGNDGLNTVVPMDQYGLYEAHRPTIKIPQTSLIGLDGTLPSNQQIGLHPSLAELKNLYDEGKMNVIQSVGYPRPNFSHFRSDSLIFGAKDGNFSNNITRGWIADYLASTHPSFSDRPTTQYPHPLGTQIGLTYKHNGYYHENFNNIGININNLAKNNFYNKSIENSEFKTLLQYINQVTENSLLYKQGIIDSFDAGSNFNGATAYPNSDLGKQFKTIARLINGGIKTKILVAFRGGWDTHHTQVDTTNTALGRHASMLSDVSKSIYAFQRDLEEQGIDDKVVVLTISEFGRQIIQNGNDGTDHGSLAPWFAVGSSIKAGVTGRNIDLSLLNGRHTADVLQNDYRRILSTLLQDWFGNSNSLLTQVGLDAFKGDEGTPDGKLDIIDDNEIVSATVADFSELFVDVFQLVKIKTEDGWTYYGRSASSTQYVFAIEHKPTDGNTQNFLPIITISDLLDDGLGNDYYKEIVGGKANFIFGKLWNMQINSGSVDGFVNMRFFLNSSRVANLQQYATDFKNSQSVGEMSKALWIKTIDSTLNPPSDFKEIGFTKAIESVAPITQGIYQSQNYYQFDSVTNFDNRGGTLCHIVTDKLAGLSDYENPGTLIFKGKLWGYNGTKWVKISL